VTDRQVSKVETVIHPWLMWVTAMPVAIALHLAWPFIWATLALCACGVLLAGFAVHLARQRKGLVGKYFGGASTVAGFAWTAAVQSAGPTRNLDGVWFIGGMTLALAWSMWSHTRAFGDQDSPSTVLSRAAAPAGMQGMRVLSLRLHGRKLVGRFRLRPGDTADDAIRRAGSMESAAGMPPGSIIMAPDLDRASDVQVTITDPRILRSPQPWPGPSAPGASIAAPIVLGVWQDGEDVRYTITNHHLQVMGGTGSGKSLGWGWGEAAETVTRRDTGMIVIDVTKGEQTMGPLRPALHLFGTTPDQARTTLRKVHKLVRARTDFLAAQGRQQWVEGCGLTHLTVYLEEAPDVINLLGDDDMDNWLSDVKAGRSAGIRWVFSLQRSDWTQMPTLVRGQLAKACFGVLDPDDARFGLSATQLDRGCAPELWGTSQPGMTYLDAACIPDARKAMPLRTWWWGEDDSVIRAHAMRWPAAARPLDTLTAGILDGAEQPATVTASQTRDHTPEDIPEPRTDLRSVNDLETGDDPMDYDDTEQVPEDLDPAAAGPASDWQFDKPATAPRMSPEEARDEFRRQLREWRVTGKRDFQITDLADLRARVGRERPWLYSVVDQLVSDGVVTKADGYPSRWVISDVA
jgi:hypothetical protein